MKLDNSIGNIQRLLDFHLQRHNVLASNLTNAETPGYKSQDLIFSETLQLAKSSVSTTNRQHIGLNESGLGVARGYTVEQPGPVGPDNNGVRMERAMAQLSANRLRYETGIEIARRKIALLKYAATDGNG